MNLQSPTNAPGYFQRYIDLVPTSNPITALSVQIPEMNNLLASIDEAGSLKAYAPDKWTLRELLQHLIDAERIFGYRALCFARGESANLPSFDEDGYATASQANRRSWTDLVLEMQTVRTTTLQLFQSFSGEMLLHTGSSGANTYHAGQLGLIIAGHWEHHARIIRERYLPVL